MVVLYSLAKEPVNLRKKGLNQQPVRWKKEKCWFIFFSQLGNEPALDGNSGTIDQDLATHPALLFQNVASAIHRSTTSVALKFPTVVPSEQHLLSFTQCCDAQWHAAYRSLGHCVEQSIVFSYKKQPAGMPRSLASLRSSGATYLKAKHSAFTAQADVEKYFQDIQARMKGYSSAYVLDFRLKKEQTTIRLHLLFAKKTTPERRAEIVAHLSSAYLQDFHVRSTDCFPPFHFY